MTALSDKVAAEHELHPASFACQCGQNFVPFRDESLVRIAHAEHVAAATERAVREQIASEIEQLVDDPPRAPLTQAARIAREGTTP